MTFTLTIDCDNAAFEDLPGGEVARLLREVARLLREVAAKLDSFDDNRGKIVDVNGNSVGAWRFGEG